MDELRDQLIAALMTAEDYEYEAAALRADKESLELLHDARGAQIEGRESHELAGTIWSRA